jgi:Family of unknown function (DUF5317)
VLIAVAAIIIGVVVPVTGGRLSNFGRLRVRGVWLVVAALAGQLLIINVIDVSENASKALHLATYAILLLFMAVNRKIPWMWLIGVGTFLNVVVIAANGGVMPLSRHAYEIAGLETSDGFNNSAILAHPRLSFLGDVFPTPKALPLSNVFSIGDFVLLAGLVLLVTTVSRVAPGTLTRYLRPADEPSS